MRGRTEPDPSQSTSAGVTPPDNVEVRKGEHLRITATQDVNTRRAPGWADVHLIHEALPDLDLEAVDLSVDFLGRRLAAPLVISGMTGGHSTAREVNRILAQAAERYGLAMGLGSQRAALHNPHLADTYVVAREHAPTAFLIGNIGAPQLIQQGEQPPLTLERVEQAVAMIRADALAIHLNFLEEVVQPEGDRRAAGAAEAIRDLASRAAVPLIGKETGAGISRGTALRLGSLGLKALDVGGVGGTSFAAIEGLRAKAQGDLKGERLGELLRDWGLPTAVSVVGASSTGLPLIATGGVRTGVDAAKALALGGTLIGVARPLLQVALEGQETLNAWIEQFLSELRTVLFLTGSANTTELRTKPRVIGGETETWLRQLGYLL